MSDATRLTAKLTERASQSTDRVYGFLRAVCYPFDRLRIAYYDLKQQPYILVYQQGRVGSTSVFESLCESKLSAPVFHVHTLSRENADQMIAQARAHGRRVNRYMVMGRLLGDSLQRRLAAQRPDPIAYIVSIVRDPIAVMLSLWFMDAGKHLNVDAGASLAANARAVIDQFIDALEADDPAQWAICKWYDSVFADETGIDVFSSPFNHEDGFTIICAKGYRVVLFRLEDMDRTFAPGMAALLDSDPQGFVLVRRNLHQNLQRADLLHEVKQQIRLPRHICEKVYRTKVVSHFYSERMIEQMIRRWEGLK